MKDGIIKIGTKRAENIGFTWKLFDGYLWKKGNTIYISFVVSHHEGKGNVRKLFETIIEQGFQIWVPTPSARMRMICEKFGGKSEWRGECEGMFIAGV